MSHAASNGRSPAVSAAGIVPPHNLDAEAAVLGAILLSDRTLHHVTLQTGLTAEHFYSESHRLVFAAMRTLFNEGAPVDQVTVASQLRREGKFEAAGGEAAIDQLYASVPNAANAPQYAANVREAATARRLLSATYEIQQRISSAPGDGRALVEEAERLVFALRANELPGQLTSLQAAVQAELERLEQEAKNDRAVPGLGTGIRELDHMLGGLHPGRLYVIAARQEMGKSLLVLQIALHVAFRESARTLFALLEMDDAETAQRYLAMESGVSPERLRLGKVKDEDWKALLDAASTAGRIPLELLDDSHVSVSSLRAHARQLAVRHGQLGLIVVDYLQLMHVEEPSGNRTVDVGNLSRGLKILARELRCPIIAVSQLNRAVEARPDKRPKLADLRETGAIEADANVVAMLYRDDYYEPDSERPGEVEIIVRKNRHGEKGTVYVQQDARLRHLPAARVA